MASLVGFDRSALIADPAGRAGRALAGAWLATRALSVVLFALLEHDVQQDVGHYFLALDGLAHGTTLAATLPEYPLPALAVLLPPYLLAGGSALGYRVLFAAAMLALDAVTQRWLWRRGAVVASRAWLVLIGVLGPLTWFRFDLVVAVLLGAAVLAGAAPARRGGLVALATAVKLWPVALLPAVLGRRDQRRTALLGFGVTGAVVVTGCLALAGVGRLLSPLAWQFHRGLQVESVPATPLLLARIVAPGRWTVDFSRWTTYEIFGTAVPAVLRLATVLLLGVLGFVVAVGRRAAQHPGDPLLVGRLVLATAALLVATGKVFSPQYVLWLIGPMCALLVLAPHERGLRRAACLLAVATAMTQFVYPVAYRHSLLAAGATAQLPGTLWLAARNVLIVAFAVVVGRQAWAASGRVDPQRELRREGLPARYRVHP